MPFWGAYFHLFVILGFEVSTVETNRDRDPFFKLSRQAFWPVKDIEKNWDFGAVFLKPRRNTFVCHQNSILLHNFIASITLIIKGFIHKPGGLDLSRLCLSRDSWSQHWQKVSLDCWENLDSFKKLVSTIEKSWSSNLDFVLTPPSSPKSLDRDWEIRQDLKFLVNLNSFFDLNPELVDVNIFLNQDF